MDIVAVTRRLTVEDVEAAYPQGIFPMSAAGGLFTWHRPSRRAILPLDGFHVSRSFARTLRQRQFEVTFNRDFLGVMRGCAERDSTWITRDFYEVYGELHRRGRAHSVEVWVEGQLAGGTYGVHFGGAFFAESKFHRRTDMSKVALHALVERLRERRFALLEVQYLTDHLATLGVIEIAGREYRRRLAEALTIECPFD